MNSYFIILEKSNSETNYNKDQTDQQTRGSQRRDRETVESEPEHVHSSLNIQPILNIRTLTPRIHLLATERWNQNQDGAMLVVYGIARIPDPRPLNATFDNLVGRPNKRTINLG